MEQRLAEHIKEITEYLKKPDADLGFFEVLLTKMWRAGVEAGIKEERNAQKTG